MVFNDVAGPALAKLWEGYNIAFLAFGQTGSGKTHTMLGNGTDPGFVYLLCQRLFQDISNRPQLKYKVWIFTNLILAICIYSEICETRRFLFIIMKMWKRKRH
jgi:hypothetical protein